MAKTYDADAVRVLADGDHLRLRPAMYVGSTDSDGIYQIAKEVIDNALDEYLGGHATYIAVELTDASVRVIDDGRGIPVEPHQQTGASTLTTVLTNLKAGGKFDTKTYAVSAGLHGVGIKATNYLSATLDAYVWRNKKCYHQSFERGRPTKEVTETKREHEGKTGTEIRFDPDPEIFGAAVLDREKLRRRLKDMSALCPGLRVLYTDNGSTAEYQDTFETLLDADGSPTFSYRSDDHVLDVALAFTDRDADLGVRGFVNLSDTPEGGTHVLGLRTALLEALQGLPGASDIPVKDILSGIVGAVHTRVHEPQFKGQTKDRLLNKEQEEFVANEMRPRIRKFFDQQKPLARMLVDRAHKLSKAREQYKKLRQAVGSVTIVRRDARGVLPGKLVEAPGCRPMDRELYVCEGDSARGSVVAARNPKIQEVLPLRGKIVNALRVDPAVALKNEEIQSMITATGLQIDPKSSVCDDSKRRVGKLMLLCDADPDGQHIAALVLGFFWRFARNVVESGMIHVVVSPLFRGTDEQGRQYWYADSVKELEKLSGLSAKKMQISRLKGHGEASAKEIRYYAMDPATRRTLRVRTQTQDGRFEALMGSDVGARKVLLGIPEDA